MGYFFILAVSAQFIAFILHLVLQLGDQPGCFLDFLLGLLNFLFSHQLVLLLPELAFPPRQFLIFLVHVLDHGLVIFLLLFQDSDLVLNSRGFLLFLVLEQKHILVDQVVQLFVKLLDHGSDLVIELRQLLLVHFIEVDIGELPLHLIGVFVGQETCVCGELVCTHP